MRWWAIYNFSPKQQTNLLQIFQNLNCILVIHKPNIINSHSLPISWCPFFRVLYSSASRSMYFCFQWCFATFFCWLKYSLETFFELPLLLSLLTSWFHFHWDQILCYFLLGLLTAALLGNPLFWGWEVVAPFFLIRLSSCCLCFLPFISCGSHTNHFLNKIALVCLLPQQELASHLLCP